MHSSALPLLIAIVDDDDGIRVALRRLLRSAGFGVQSYGSGGEFLGQVADAVPDCLVLDLHMPGQSGFEVLRSLANRRPALPVVVLTGDDTAGNRQRARANGASAFLVKPVNDETLIDAVVAAIRNRSHV